MKFITHIRFRHVFRAVRLPLLTAASAVLLADIWCETVGVPDFAAKYLSKILASKGVSGHVGRVKAGFFRGVKLYEVVVWDGEMSGQRMFTAERIHLRLRRPPLLLGRLRPSRIGVDGGALFFPTPEKEGSPRLRPFKLEQLHGSAYISRDRIVVEHLRGTLNGLWVRAEGDIVGFSASLREVKSGSPVQVAGTGRLSWQGVSKAIPRRVADLLVQASAFLDEQLFVTADALVRSDFHLDLSNFTDCEANLRCQFTGVSINGVAVSRMKGHLALQGGRVYLHNGILDVGLATHVTGRGIYDIHRGRVSGQIEGAVSPRVAYRFLNRPMPRFLAEVSLPVPPGISLLLRDSDITRPETWELSGSIRLNNAMWAGTHIRTAACQFVREGGVTTVEELTVNVDREGKERIAVSCRLDEDSLVLSGKGVAHVSPDRFLRLLPQGKGLDLLRELVLEGDVPTLTFTLDRASWDPFELRGEASLEARKLSFRDIEISSVLLPLKFDGRILQTVATGARIDGAGDQFMLIHGKLDVEQETWSARGQAAVFPNKTYTELGFPESELMAELHMGSEPVQVSFAAESIPLDLESWGVKGTVTARDFSYGQARITEATADYELSPKGISLATVTGESPQMEDFRVQALDYNWHDNTTTLKLKGRFNPLLLSAFVPPSDRDVYEDVWKGFEWQDGDPFLDIADFRLQLFPSGRYTLALEGTISDEQMRLYGQELDEARARVVLDLPRKITVSDIRVTENDAWLVGEVGFDLGAETVLTLDCEGQFEPIEVLRKAMPDLSETLKGVDAGKDTRLELDGQVYLRGKSRPQINCRMHGRRLSARGLVLEDYDAEWQLSNHEIKWAINNADVCGGKIMASGYSNGFTQSGNIDARFAGLGLTSLLTNYTGSPAIENLGKLSGRFSLNMVRSLEDRDLALLGSGRLKVRDGEFYRTPLLQSLVEVVGLSGVGKISAVDAEVEFRGDHLVIPRFATDGTILALRGDGTYRWDGPRKGLNFVVSGEVLKATSLIPLITRPLSWFFEAELTGTLDEPKWRMRSPLRILTPGKNGGAKDDDFDLLPPKR